VVKAMGIDLATFQPTGSAFLTRQRASVPGTRSTTEATVVHLRISAVIRGKRRVSPRSVSVYVTSVDGHWRYIDGLGNPLVPHCLAPPTETLGSELLAKVPSWAMKQGFTNNPQAVAGAKLFAVSGCLNCHTYLGLGGGFAGAPNLTAEGAKNKGTDFQIRHLKNPAGVNPGSPMPSFQRLGTANLTKLAAFLEASKG
jgi:mono/diheme cytochrome c family protein